MTVLEIIQDAVSDGLGLPRDPIQNDVMAEGIARYRKVGKVIFDLFPWDNRKTPNFDTDDATYMTSYDTDTGIITFAATIDIVRAIRAVSTSNTAPDGIVYAQSEINAAINGVDVSSGRFDPLPDDSNGCRRILIQKDDAVAKYRILATARFIPAIIDSAYDSTDPSATPTDYRVLEWPIDHADSAIIAYMSDELRGWDGQRLKNDWKELLSGAIGKVTEQQARGKEVFPQVGMFGDLGDDTYADETWGRKT